MTYRAIRACWHKKRFYKPGAIFVPAERGEKPPRHFVADEEFSIEAVEEAAKVERLKRVRVKAQKAADAGGPSGSGASKD
ncbi:MAG: hypothetical protein A4E67_00063 [Syntrophaceae bacterium PtaB.Bin038]|nr:MAG: hypothetical protein A4E67_00063 [Syntrophaceae bacterium PtaB.Bin038]